MGENLTIIIVAVAGDEALRTCANAVRAQAPNLLLVARGGMITDGEGRCVGVSEPCNIPSKRKTAVELASTPLVGLIEDTVLPGPGWVGAVQRALKSTDVVACGGPVSIDPGLPASSRALALAEYGAFNRERPAGALAALPGCNFAFRRDALLAAMAGGEGLADQLIFERLREQGGVLVWTPDMDATVCRANNEGARLATRFRHGRIYASSGDRRDLVRRVMSTAKALLLPPVLTVRSLRNAAPPERRSLQTLGWLMLQHTAWAAGELTGAVLGPSTDGLNQWQ